MKIIVLVKEVPDTYTERKLDLETGLADRAASEAVLDEISERALEVALAFADSNDAEIVVLSMAPESAAATIRKALAMGASSAVHVADPAVAGADLGLTARILAAAIRRTGFDLVITGNLSTDGNGGVLPAMLAELLDVPNATALSSVEITADAVSGTRNTDDSTMRVSAKLPAVISITEALPAGRFPNFKGIMAAKKKPFETLSLADLGIEPNDFSVAMSIMTAIAEKPQRTAGVKITDQGDGGTKIAEYLIENRLV
jgi:electron transfer flavoprotein beta subunit